MDDGIKILPTKVINCTPKPFQGVAIQPSGFPSKIAPPASQQHVYEQISPPSPAPTTEPILFKDPNSKVENKASKLAKMNQANRAEHGEEKGEPAKENAVISQDELKNILSGQPEPDSPKKVSIHGIRLKI